VLTGTPLADPAWLDVLWLVGFAVWRGTRHGDPANDDLVVSSLLAWAVPLLGTEPVTGLDAVRAAAGFDVVAPDTIAGLARTNALLVGGKQAILVYGEGPGSIVVAERKADIAQRGGLMKALPPVSLGGVTGHELTTQLGTLIEWQRGGVAFVLAGSVASATAETAARDVK